ncbi:diguanylate cyclase [Domibacillus indicus]|uniref:diguanylate cyclase n=1 Tax=Domibacillus indicus TaxID=1437523 RepID=UPI000698D03F|nr:diguanylate cyclase [Domibacillus indicus]
MYRDLIINLAIIISFLAVSGEAFKHQPMYSSKRTKIMGGVFAGVIGIILMTFSIQVTETIIIDLRLFTIILAVIYGGMLSGTIAAIICSVSRVLLFGVNESSVTAVVIFILFTVACALIRKTNLTVFRKFMVMNAGSVVLVSIALVFLMEDTQKLAKTLLYFGGVCAVGGFVIYYISSYIVRSNENFRKLQLFEKVLETTQQGIMITDAKGKIVFVNGGFTSITGYSPEEALQQNPRMLKSGKHDPAFYRKMWKDLKHTGQWKGEIWNKGKDGHAYAELINISEVTDKFGNTMNYVGVFTDITELKEAERKMQEANERLQAISSLDGLTGIANRRTFDGLLEKEWNRALRYQQPLSLIMLDIDYFKKFNDTYGHLEGDDCLKKVAAALAGSVPRPADAAARYGGEEFAVILPDTNEKQAHLIAETMRKAIVSLQIPHIQSAVSSSVTVSVGAATMLPEQAVEPDQLIRCADRALYNAKENGRNQVKVYQFNLQEVK